MCVDGREGAVFECRDLMGVDLSSVQRELRSKHSPVLGPPLSKPAGLA